MKTTASSPQEVEHLRDRVRLFLQVMLVVDLAAHVSDAVNPLIIPDLEPMSFPLYATVVRWAATFGLIAAWAAVRFLRPARLVLIAVEVIATFCLVWVYLVIGFSFEGWADPSSVPLFSMLGLALLLVVRASLVPSPVSRTLVVGVGMLVCFMIYVNASIPLEPTLVDGLTFIGGAFVVVTSVTSHVIYGLRREVRAALQLGQYTLEQKLGEGGMGSVHRARHAMLRRRAAVKLIRPELAGEGARRERALRRFEREAQATADLKSPHTIELYDFGVSDDGAFYYVMELLDGINLEVAVDKYGPMPPERVVYLLAQVCDSLEEAHAAGLVHRDVKPANIFLCHHGLRFDFVKVLDFGLVTLGREPDRDPKLTAEGLAAGTPAYIAPEMVASPDAVDGRADIYALGCVAYYLLSGQPPFERENAMATILAHVNDAPPPVDEVAEIAVPEPLAALVHACLAKSPEERPSSVPELCRRLRTGAPEAGWDQERAATWWAHHKPSLEPAAASAGQTARLTKAMR